MRFLWYEAKQTKSEEALAIRVMDTKVCHKQPSTTIQRREAVRVLGRVLEQAHAHTVVVEREQRHAQKAPPADAQHERVVALQRARVPPVALDVHLHEAHALLGAEQLADDEWVRRVEVLHQFCGDGL
jgi:hypothetical protein